jgi:hypothetical protein
MEGNSIGPFGVCRWFTNTAARHGPARNVFLGLVVMGITVTR